MYVCVVCVLDIRRHVGQASACGGHLERVRDDPHRSPHVWRLHVQRTHCRSYHAQLLCHWMLVLTHTHTHTANTGVNDIEFVSDVLSFCVYRHAAQLELHTHVVVGSEPVRDLLHPGGSRALFHRCLHRVLHHHQTLPVLPHACQHAGIPAEPPRSNLVPHVLLLWVQRKRSGSERILLALHSTCNTQETRPLKHTHTFVLMILNKPNQILCCHDRHHRCVLPLTTTHTLDIWTVIVVLLGGLEHKFWLWIFSSRNQTYNHKIEFLCKDFLCIAQH